MGLVAPEDRLIRQAAAEPDSNLPLPHPALASGQRPVPPHTGLLSMTRFFSEAAGFFQTSSVSPELHDHVPLLSGTEGTAERAKTCILDC